MDNSEVFVGLDIGSTSIKALVCENVKGQLKVVGVGIAPSTGLNHGVIVDIDKTAHAISQAVAQAEEKSNLTIKKLIVGLPPADAKGTRDDHNRSPGPVTGNREPGCDRRC